MIDGSLRFDSRTCFSGKVVLPKMRANIVIGSKKEMLLVTRKIHTTDPSSIECPFKVCSRITFWMEPSEPEGMTRLVSGKNQGVV